MALYPVFARKNFPHTPQFQKKKCSCPGFLWENLAKKPSTYTVFPEKHMHENLFCHRKSLPRGIFVNSFLLDASMKRRHAITEPRGGAL